MPGSLAPATGVVPRHRSDARHWPAPDVRENTRSCCGPEPGRSASVRQSAGSSCGRAVGTPFAHRTLPERRRWASGLPAGCHSAGAPHAELVRLQRSVDATIIHAPSSTKNKDGKRDPDMHQTKKGNQYYFGMKAYIGVDDDSGLVHSVIGTEANVADVTQVDKLLHAKSRMSARTPAIPASKNAPSMSAARSSGRLPLAAVSTSRSARAACSGA
ncbi:hypothetical protein OF001_U60150 [Pseudomonas sp. OF001]|nr:hypothetical protein OF001_U60150 [Pseudomonas sp. OF001]